jgi:hypothetical protein
MAAIVHSVPFTSMLVLPLGSQDVSRSSASARGHHQKVSFPLRACHWLVQQCTWLFFFFVFISGTSLPTWPKRRAPEHLTRSTALTLVFRLLIPLPGSDSWLMSFAAYAVRTWFSTSPSWLHIILISVVPFSRDQFEMSGMSDRFDEQLCSVFTSQKLV